jgi:hypothetical protein
VNVDAPPLDSEAAHGESEVKRDPGCLSTGTNRARAQSDGLDHVFLTASATTTQAIMQGRS